MPRGNQVARLYRLLGELQATRRGSSAEALARKRGWHLRTVYRDLQALEDAGFPIVRTGGARWKLIDDWQQRVPFPMPLGQLLALHAARDLVAPLRGTPVARDLDALWERLSGLPSSRSREQGELFPKFRRILATRSQLAIDYSRHGAILESLCRACETRRTAQVAYFVETRREETRRRIDPYQLYYDPSLEALYVFAWCHLRRAMRTFAVHRFRRVTLSTREFEVPAGFTPESHLRGAFRIWRGENAVKIRLLLEPEVAGWITERRWHASQKERRRGGGRSEVEFTVDGVREIRRFILQLGASVAVLEPEWLRREIAEEHRAAAERAFRGDEDFLTLDDTGVGDKGGG